MNVSRSRMKKIYNDFQKSNFITLSDAYKKCSDEKIIAYLNCLTIMDSFLDDFKLRNPSSFVYFSRHRIISYNNFMFTFGFEIVVEFFDERESEKYFVYISKDITCIYPIDELI